MAEHSYILPEDVPSAVSAAIEAGSFRPTAIILAHTISGQFITVNSPKEPFQGVYWLPQGGLGPDKDETPEGAALRELSEELGVYANSATVIGATEYATRPRDGFVAGKLLVACSVPLDTDEPEIAADDKEVRSWRLQSAEDTVAMLGDNAFVRPESGLKVDFSIRMIESIDLRH